MAAKPVGRPVIILAGGTGDLGFRIARHLVARGGEVRALVRPGNTKPEVAALRELGASVVEVDFDRPEALGRACVGGDCVVSALSGLHDVIVGVQSRLLEAALAAGVPRFIPSDFSIDFTKLPEGSNRNLDLRREFQARLDAAPIQATSILNGMFADLLTGQAPVVLFGPRRILYWGDADQPLDFTTIEDTATYTAAAALDPTTPRFLRIAGDVLTIRQLCHAATEATGTQFRLLRAGSLGLLGAMIAVTRTLAPQPREVYPPWQGMQYLHNMLSGVPKLAPLDTNRYPDLTWMPVREVLKRR